MFHLVSVLTFIVAVGLQSPTAVNRAQINIVNTGSPISVDRSYDFNGGVVVGNMLNIHYFPALRLYNAGRYADAEPDLTYVILRPFYLDGNAAQNEYLSIAHYLRGMILFYHSSGVGRLSAARKDFEFAIKLNPNNHSAYLELGRLYSSLNFKEQALSVLHHLLDASSDETLKVQARDELATLERSN
jgi:tetratricopeptide (TPR) repeat protein